MRPTDTTRAVAGDIGNQLSQVDGERDGERGQRSGRDDEERAPAIEECGERTERVADVDVDAAGLGAHGAELRVGERAEEGEESAGRPHAEREEGVRAGVREDEPGDEEDAGADDDADGGEGQVGGAEQAGERRGGGGRGDRHGRQHADENGIQQRYAGASAKLVVFALGQ